MLRFTIGVPDYLDYPLAVKDEELHLWFPTDAAYRVMSFKLFGDEERLDALREFDNGVFYKIKSPLEILGVV